MSHFAFCLHAQGSHARQSKTFNKRRNKNKNSFPDWRRPQHPLSVFFRITPSARLLTRVALASAALSLHTSANHFSNRQVSAPNASAAKSSHLCARCHAYKDFKIAAAIVTPRTTSRLSTRTNRQFLIPERKRRYSSGQSEKPLTEAPEGSSYRQKCLHDMRSPY